MSNEENLVATIDFNSLEVEINPQLLRQQQEGMPRVAASTPGVFLVGIPGQHCGRRRSPSQHGVRTIHAFFSFFNAISSFRRAQRSYSCRSKFIVVAWKPCCLFRGAALCSSSKLQEPTPLLLLVPVPSLPVPVLLLSLLLAVLLLLSFEGRISFNVTRNC